MTCPISRWAGRSRSSPAPAAVSAPRPRRLAREGAAVALVAHRRDRQDRLAGDIASLGGHAVAVAADITGPERRGRSPIS
jgi:NADP-dependent 3-hydroxy acid dehydrogenase YdfG